MRRAAITALAALLCSALLSSVAPAQQADPLRLIKLPPGFSIELYARVPKARTMVLKEDWGVTLVGSRGPVVHAVLDSDKDGRANAIGAIFEDLKLGNGIAWKDGWFYIAEQHRLVRYKAPDINTLAQAKPQVLFDKFPDNSWHGWRYARFGPDGMLYVAIGAPCNICLTNGLEGTIVRFNTDSLSGLVDGAPNKLKPEIFATGVRNSVGFDFHPTTGDLYFTDNGADNMGDDSPPDEFNHAPKKDMWFGFPWFGGGRDRTPDFKGKPVPRQATFPVINFGAHVASLGISFYTGDQFPTEYKGDAFVAQHGSWNRSVPDGYRIVRIKFDKKTKKAISKEIFADGWLLPDGQSWGRPVDVKQTKDGSLLVSDDRAGAIYRIRYTKP